MRTTSCLPRLFFGLLSALLAFPAFGQDARSFAMGQCGSGLDWGPTALVWNPASLQFSIPTTGWAMATSGSAFDSTNTGGAALDFDMDAASQSPSDPVRRHQSYQGLAALQMKTAAGGILYDQENDLALSQGTADFLNDRNKGTLGDNTYGLGGSSKLERIETLALGYSQAIPLGQISAALGGTLKIHQGSRFDQTLMEGSFTKGTAGGYNYQQWSASSGTGFSWDLGLMIKPTSTIQIGILMADINSSYKWKAHRTQLTLDPLTGAQSASTPVDETVQSNRPRITRMGFTFHNQDRTSVLTGESVHQAGETVWHFGFERIMAEQHLVLRLGTFKDLTSDRRIWTGGAGYFGRSFEVDLGVAARQVPVIQDSAGFGIALSFSMVL